jgi:hypothetical protein
MCKTYKLFGYSGGAYENAPYHYYKTVGSRDVSETKNSAALYNTKNIQKLHNFTREQACIRKRATEVASLPNDFIQLDAEVIHVALRAERAALEATS